MTPGQQDLFPDPDGARSGNGRRRTLILPKLLAAAGNDARLHSTSAHQQAHQILIRWADLETSGKLRRRKETTLEGEFFNDVFGKALGYTLFSENLPDWQLNPRYNLPGGQADGAIGFFETDSSNPPTALIELKGPTVNLDRARFNGRTPVQQCWDYLNAVPACPWGIVCNYVSFRLYHRNKTPHAYELFSLQELRDRDRFRAFYCLFARGGLLPTFPGQKSRADELLAQSEHRQREVGRELYDDYHKNRIALIDHLRKAPHNKPLEDSIHIVQKLLDRIIFVAFCEDRNLLPARTIDRAWRDFSPFSKVRNPRWQNFRELFQSIDTGNRRFDIDAYNGGLFKNDPQVDDLDLDDEWTDFFREISVYDFKDEVNVDVLGHLFERSITDLETLRADPDAVIGQTGRLATGRRKREGVYYTPPQVTECIVANTVGTCIEERFAALGEEYNCEPTDTPDRKHLANWIKYNQARLEALRDLRIVDPACGSGAFLIQAFDYLEGVYDEVVDALCLHQGREDRKLREDISATILRNNLFGVDLSDEAVQITRLALWIRTAQRGKTLEDLSDNIHQGNSIVDDAKVDARAFDWSSAFGSMVADGKFDCVISNPPYVKLQNFRKREPKIAAYLPHRFASARTGNFDMYLPFIERGLDLLKPNGRMGYIAPSVWLYNEYGQGLRELVARQRCLERFVDFKSHQVFDDATTYTALQFFSPARRRSIEVADAGDGQVSAPDFYKVPYKGLGSGSWALLRKSEQAILDKMREKSVTLAEASAGIIVGIQTSADSIYHLIKLGPGKYFSKALDAEVEIEDEIMKPLVSGEEAIPYATPDTDKYLLFPYRVDHEGANLLTQREMKRFRRCWKYLKDNEQALRGREHGKMDHDSWYAYVYPKNLDKQHLPKLMVPRLLLKLFGAVDPKGQIFLDNVDVGGILVDKRWGIYFLLGLLNSSALNFAWRLTSKPFRGDYRSANKQFIAPLPIPQTKKQAAVAKLARTLADLHARRQTGLAKVHRRFITDLPEPVLLPTSPLPPSLPKKLLAFERLSAAQLLQAMEKFAKGQLKPQQREDWDEYLTARKGELAGINAKIANAQGQLDERVAQLYGLSAADMKVIGQDSLA